MHNSTPAQYYRAIADVLRQHLAGRDVRTTGGPNLVARPVVDSVNDLTALSDGGVVGFSTRSAGRLVLRAVPGEGADIATAATAVLALAESLAADGLVPVSLIDGAGGLLLIAATTAPDPALQARRYAESVAARAPEIATLDPDAADGRALIDISGSDAARDVPAPYSLVESADGEWGAVIPITIDEVAATTAGMPLELEPADVAGRLARHGDLAAALAHAGVTDA